MMKFLTPPLLFLICLFCFTSCVIEEDSFAPELETFSDTYLHQEEGKEFISSSSTFPALTDCGCQVNIVSITGTAPANMAAFDPGTVTMATHCTTSNQILGSTALTADGSYLLTDGGYSDYFYYFRLKKVGAGTDPMVTFNVLCYGGAKYSGYTQTPNYSVVATTTFYGVEIPNPTSENGFYSNPCEPSCF